ncbi:MAG: hypothetical protein IJV74_01970 [Clostridia bacterium]|nr:hypothetical protein [Clostridia bacterium]
MKSKIEFTKTPIKDRIFRMLSVDLYRMFTTRFFYIMLLISFAVPILILVMTTMMDGQVSVDPQTGVETVIEGFDYVWQIFGTVSGAPMAMDLTGMCNINLMYFAVSVLVCVFVSGDFRSGYAKNIFAVRADKTDYVVSKSLTCFLASAAMLLAFILGSLIGGAVASVSFEMVGFGAGGLILSLISKLLIPLIFVPIYLLAGVIAKDKTWLSICISLGVGMLLFMMIPALAPLDATVINPIVCLVVGLLASLGLGAISRAVLNKTPLV